MNDHDLQAAKEPIFSRKKNLLSVGQYASRQGVSTGIVQEAARLGVVQVRKHKDKTFIVDLPLDTYKMLKQPDWGSSEGVDTTAGANKISELVNRIFQSDSVLEKSLKKSAALPAKNVGHAADAVARPQITAPAVIPDLRLFAEEESNAKAATRQVEDELVNFRVPFFRGVMDSTRTMPRWKVNTIVVAMAAAIIACVFTYTVINRKIQQEKLHQAYENIGKLMTEYENAKQKAQMYEFDALSLRSEAERSKKALLGSENELNEVRKRLYEARKDLQSSQQEKTGSNNQ
ncbi:MAG: hypothetical protein WC770_03835 [Phycisphaerae bacterium]